MEDKMFKDFDEEEKVTPQEALDSFYHHCMEYVSMYDYEENDVGDYEAMDDDTRDMWKQPLQELVNRDEPKEVKNNRCPNCECMVDTKDQFCPHCGQRLLF